MGQDFFDILAVIYFYILLSAESQPYVLATNKHILFIAANLFSYLAFDNVIHNLNLILFFSDLNCHSSTHYLIFLIGCYSLLKLMVHLFFFMIFNFSAHF